MDDDPGFSDDGRDLCQYRWESRAYQALQASGLCDQEIVRRFYGVFENIDPSMLSMFGSSLGAFKEDKERPYAILLEYLPGSKNFSSEIFSPELFERAIAGLEKIHAAGVIHNDPYPRNVLVVPGEGGGCIQRRVVWIDFDVSIVFSADTAGRTLDLDLDEETECEIRVFKSRVRKTVSEKNLKTPICSEA